MTSKIFKQMTTTKPDSVEINIRKISSVIEAPIDASRSTIIICHRTFPIRKELIVQLASLRFETLRKRGVFELNF
jgi:hypothetical protein